MSITLAQLVEKARQRADLENNEFIGEAEAIALINDAWAELYDLIVDTANDYFVSSAALTTFSGQEDYDLPADFYKLRGVDLQLDGSEYRALSPFNFNKRNSKECGYRLLGNKLRLSPTPSGTRAGLIWYVPNPEPLVADADVLLDLNQAEFVILAAALKMRLKEDLPLQELMALKAEQKERVVTALTNRDMGDSSQITDVYPASLPGYYWNTGDV